MPVRPRWTLTLAPTDDGRPAMADRVKHLLEIAARVCGLTCVAKRIEPDAPAAPDRDASHSPRRH